MFSNSGYFRGLNCPFYSNGTCRRPYCHFRHVRNQAETEKLQSTKPKGNIDGVYPQTADVSKYMLNASPPSSSPVPQELAAKKQPVQYVPTPIAEIALARRRHKMAAKASKRGHAKNAAPMYVPTPLSQISSSAGTDSNSQKTQVRRNKGATYYSTKTSETNAITEKYTLNQDHPVNNDEYDPFGNNLYTNSNPEKSVRSDLSSPSSKYSLDEACSKSNTDLVYDPLDNSACNPNGVKDEHGDSCASGEETEESNSTTSANDTAAMPSDEEDGLYSFDNPENVDSADGADEYEPMLGGEDIGSLHANYTPTTKYSVDSVPPNPTNDLEYDPFSNFTAKEHLKKSNLPKKRKKFPETNDCDQSSDSDALMIIEEQEIHSSSTDEESKRKKLKHGDVEQEDEECTEEETDKLWLSNVQPKHFLQDVNFHPPSDNDVPFTPSYSYSPSDYRPDDHLNTSLEDEWNPTKYLTELSANPSITKGSSQLKNKLKKHNDAKQQPEVRKKTPEKRKLKDGTGKNESSSKPKSKIKNKNTTKPNLNSSKSKDLTSKSKDLTSKSKETQNATPANTKHSDTNESKINDDKCNEKDSPEEKPRMKVSSELLSSFFNKICEKKQQKAKPLSGNNQQGKCKTTQSLNECGDNGLITARNPSCQDDDVILISSSPSDNDQPNKGNVTKKARSTHDDKGKLLQTKKPAKICNRKSSNIILFGEDSDSDNTDEQLARHGEEKKMVLFSDCYSSSDTNSSTRFTSYRPTDDPKRSTTLSKRDTNGFTADKSSHTSLPKSVKRKTGPKSRTVPQHGVEKPKESKHLPHNHKTNKQTDKKSGKVPEIHQIKSDEKTRLKKKISHSPGKVLRAVMMSDSSDNSDNDNAMNNPDDDFTLISDSDNNDLDATFSESDTFEECLKIFKEEPLKQPNKVQEKVKEPQECKKEDLVMSTSKQRVAHVSIFDVSKHKRFTPRPKVRPSPLQVCHNRYMQAQQHLEEKQNTLKATSPEVKVATNQTSSSSSKKRVAHVPPLQIRQTPPNKSATVRPFNTPVMGINAKIQQKYSIGHSASYPTGHPSKTVAISAPKGERRLAHLPQKVNPRPIIPPDKAGKVPCNIRQRYLNLFIDEYLKTTQTEQEAFQQGLKEEKSVYERASSRNIYLNLSVNTLKRLRSAQTTDTPDKVTSPTSKGSISHEAVIGGKAATQHTFTLNRSHQSTAQLPKYEGTYLYEILKTYLMTEDQLVDNGYPRPSETPGLAVIKVDDSKKSTGNQPNQYVCCRCGKTFLRRSDGHYITRENCIFHWGKFWHNKVGGTLEGRFTCCSGDSSAKGCSVSKYHVTDDKTNNLTGFMRTVAKSPPANGNPGLYAMDCEMCYTVKGLELTRVTVVDDKLNCVYDTLVKPNAEIVDYNTRFSGITEDDLKDVTTTLQDVQAVLLSMCSSQSIIIGHSLESDLLSLKMIHSQVIDTAVLFPHRRGLPFKRALRTLMAECLNRIIQNDVGGHDSKEDAASCMELMIWKAKQDAKKRSK
ncbi:RNA exonuclease 1 homolog [Asterias rubens]|uniref:RNA exonuclease 1 homolog n=1 Tax=Asterias rubens TaxID=7604 RepID=UPI00145570FF|nr:RNA exonuclease 1 homolog [Asterias rubens]